MEAFNPAAFAALALAGSFSVLAESTLEDTVIVTATRTPLALEDILAPVIIITGEDLRRTATTDIAEALRLQAGIEIGRNGGPGQPTSLFIRGTNSNHTQVLIDGVRINPGTLGGAAVHHIRPQDIERIEIVKGPRSSLYGSEAIGGVVNIITKRADTGTTLSAEAGGGRYGTRSFGVGIRGASAAVFGGVRADRLDTDGFPSRTGTTVKQGHDNLTINGHVGVRHEGGSVELRLWRAGGNTEYLDFFLTPLDQDFRNEVTSLEVRQRLGAGTEASLRVARASDELEQRQSPDFASTHRGSLDLHINHRLEGSEVSGGLMLNRERTEAEVFGSAFSERPDTKALFGQWLVTGADRRWLVATRVTDHDAFGIHWTGNAEFGQRLSDDWRLIVSLGTAFRAPDSTQRFGFGGNPDLQPERSRNFEIGLRGALGTDSRVEWNLFQNHISSLINFDNTTFTLENIDRARVQGTELVYRFNAGAWHFRQNIVLQSPINRSTGEPLPRRAKRSAQTALSFAVHDSLVIGGDLLLASRRKDSGFSTDMIGGYALLNLFTEWELSGDWMLDARLENALAKRYETALGYPQAGRAVYLRLRWQQDMAD